MGKIRTHYDNLKVARNAPPEVIRAAYRTLSQKYHPDVNPNNLDAHRIMGLLNVAYEILSDPIKRKDYDEWIIRKEFKTEERNYANNANSTPPPQPPPPRPSSPPVTPNTGFGFDLSKYWGWLIVAGIFIFLYAINSSTPKKHVSQQNSPPIASNGKSSSHHPPQIYKVTKADGTVSYTNSPYIRPATAPNDQPWPNKSGYIKGYKRLYTKGLSTVTIDNSQNDSDVFAKLFSIDIQPPLVVRCIYIAPKDKFTMKSIRAGNYDVRYRDLESGALLKAESFQLEEIPTEDKVQYSNVSMTLYKVYNGNMQTTEISEAEFGVD